MRQSKVVRFTPRRAAALSAPPMRPLHAVSTRAISSRCLLSYSSATLVLSPCEFVFSPEIWLEFMPVGIPLGSEHQGTHEVPSVLANMDKNHHNTFISNSRTFMAIMAGVKDSTTLELRADMKATAETSMATDFTAVRLSVASRVARRCRHAFWRLRRVRPWGHDALADATRLLKKVRQCRPRSVTSTHAPEPCRTQFQQALSRSTFFHERGSALADFLELHFKAMKLLRG